MIKNYLFYTKAKLLDKQAFLTTNSITDFSKFHNFSFSINGAYAVCDNKLLAWIPQSQNLYDDNLEFLSFPPISFTNFGSKKVVKICCNSEVVHAITEDYLVFSWGTDTTNQGLLAMGNVFEVKTPTLNNHLSSLGTMQISLSEKHGAVIDSYRNLFTWGNGANGQLGDKSIQMSLIPRKVVLNENFNIIRVECGKDCTCGITIDKIAFYFGKIDSSVNIKSTSLNEPKNDIIFIPLLSDKIEVENIICGEKLLSIISSTGGLYLYTETQSLFRVKIPHKIEQVKFISDTFYALTPSNKILYEFVHYPLRASNFDINDYVENSYKINKKCRLKILQSPYFVKVLFCMLNCSIDEKENIENSLSKVFIKNKHQITNNEGGTDNKTISCIDTKTNNNDYNSIYSFNNSNKSRVNKISTLLGNIFEKKIETIVNNNKSIYFNKDDNNLFLYGKKRIELIKIDNELLGNISQYSDLYHTVKDGNNDINTNEQLFKDLKMKPSVELQILRNDEDDTRKTFKNQYFADALSIDYEGKYINSFRYTGSARNNEPNPSYGSRNKFLGIIPNTDRILSQFQGDDVFQNKINSIQNIQCNNELIDDNNHNTTNIKIKSKSLGIRDIDNRNRRNNLYNILDNNNESYVRPIGNNIVFDSNNINVSKPQKIIQGVLSVDDLKTKIENMLQKNKQRNQNIFVLPENKLKENLINKDISRDDNKEKEKYEILNINTNKKKDDIIQSPNMPGPIIQSNKLITFDNQKNSIRFTNNKSNEPITSYNQINKEENGMKIGIRDIETDEINDNNSQNPDIIYNTINKCQTEGKIDNNIGNEAFAKPKIHKMENKEKNNNIQASTVSTSINNINKTEDVLDNNKSEQKTLQLMQFIDNQQYTQQNHLIQPICKEEEEFDKSKEMIDSVPQLISDNNTNTAKLKNQPKKKADNVSSLNLMSDNSFQIKEKLINDKDINPLKSEDIKDKEEKGILNAKTIEKSNEELIISINDLIKTVPIIKKMKDQSMHNWCIKVIEEQKNQFDNNLHSLTKNNNTESNILRKIEENSYQEIESNRNYMKNGMEINEDIYLNTIDNDRKTKIQEFVDKKTKENWDFNTVHTNIYNKTNSNHNINNNSDYDDNKPILPSKKESYNETNTINDLSNDNNEKLLNEVLNGSKILFNIQSNSKSIEGKEEKIDIQNSFQGNDKINDIIEQDTLIEDNNKMHSIKKQSNNMLISKNFDDETNDNLKTKHKLIETQTAHSNYSQNNTNQLDNYTNTQKYLNQIESINNTVDDEKEMIDKSNQNICNIDDKTNDKKIRKNNQSYMNEIENQKEEIKESNSTISNKVTNDKLNENINESINQPLIPSQINYSEREINNEKQTIINFNEKNDQENIFLNKKDDSRLTMQKQNTESDENISKRKSIDEVIEIEDNTPDIRNDNKQSSIKNNTSKTNSDIENSKTVNENQNNNEHFELIENPNIANEKEIQQSIIKTGNESSLLLQIQYEEIPDKNNNTDKEQGISKQTERKNHQIVTNQINDDLINDNKSKATINNNLREEIKNSNEKILLSNIDNKVFEINTLNNYINPSQEKGNNNVNRDQVSNIITQSNIEKNQTEEDHQQIANADLIKIQGEEDISSLINNQKVNSKITNMEQPTHKSISIEKKELSPVAQFKDNYSNSLNKSNDSDQINELIEELKEKTPTNTNNKGRVELKSQQENNSSNNGNNIMKIIRENVTESNDHRNPHSKTIKMDWYKLKTKGETTIQPMKVYSKDKQEDLSFSHSNIVHTEPNIMSNQLNENICQTERRETTSQKEKNNKQMMTRSIAQLDNKNKIKSISITSDIYKYKAKDKEKDKDKEEEKYSKDQINDKEFISQDSNSNNFNNNYNTIQSIQNQKCKSSYYSIKQGKPMTSSLAKQIKSKANKAKTQNVSLNKTIGKSNKTSNSHLNINKNQDNATKGSKSRSNSHKNVLYHHKHSNDNQLIDTYTQNINKNKTTFQKYQDILNNHSNIDQIEGKSNSIKHVPANSYMTHSQKEDHYHNHLYQLSFSNNERKDIEIQNNNLKAKYTKLLKINDKTEQYNIEEDERLILSKENNTQEREENNISKDNNNRQNSSKSNKDNLDMETGNENENEKSIEKIITSAGKMKHIQGSDDNSNRKTKLEPKELDSVSINKDFNLVNLEETQLIQSKESKILKKNKESPSKTHNKDQSTENINSDNENERYEISNSNDNYRIATNKTQELSSIVNQRVTVNNESDNNNNKNIKGHPTVIKIKSNQELLSILQSEESPQDESIYYIIEGGDENLTDIQEDDEYQLDSLNPNKKLTSQVIKVKNNQVISIAKEKQIKNFIKEHDPNSQSLMSNQNKKNNDNQFDTSEEGFLINRQISEANQEIGNEDNKKFSKHKSSHLFQVCNQKSIISGIKSQFIPFQESNQYQYKQLNQGNNLTNAGILSGNNNNNNNEHTNLNIDSLRHFKSQTTFQRAKTGVNSASTTQRNKKMNIIEKAKRQHFILSEEKEINPTPIVNKEMANNPNIKDQLSNANVIKPHMRSTNAKTTQNSNSGINQSVALTKEKSNVNNKSDTHNKINRNNNAFLSPKHNKKPKTDQKILSNSNKKTNSKSTQLNYINNGNYQTPSFVQSNKLMKYTKQESNDILLKSSEKNKENQKLYDQKISLAKEEEDQAFSILKQKYNDFLYKVYGESAQILVKDRADEVFLKDLAKNQVPIEENNLDSIKLSTNMREFIIHSLENFKLNQVKERLEMMKEKAENNNNIELAKSNLLGLIALDDEDELKDKSNMLEPMELDKSWISINFRKSFVDSLRNSSNENIFSDIGVKTVKAVSIQLFGKDKK